MRVQPEISTSTVCYTCQARQTLTCICMCKYAHAHTWYHEANVFHNENQCLILFKFSIFNWFVYTVIFSKTELKGMWYIGDEQILLIMGFYMFVTEVHTNLFSKFGKW